MSEWQTVSVTYYTGPYRKVTRCVRVKSDPVMDGRVLTVRWNDHGKRIIRVVDNGNRISVLNREGEPIIGHPDEPTPEHDIGLEAARAVWGVRV